MATPAKALALEQIRMHLLEEFSTREIAFATDVENQSSSKITLSISSSLTLSDSFCSQSASNESPISISYYSTISPIFQAPDPIFSSEINLEENLHYRGVRQHPWGKYTAKIWDPNQRSSRIWLGTFDTAIEAAKAYDKVAFELCDSKAIVNFPLEIQSMEFRSCAPMEVGRKRSSEGERRKRKPH
ncbi:ethylene-responsive transcription factor 5-like [Olea europaea var. sylvestris]|uniref:ethylene-responsive transcription factor 5-like n=1 Tax=Olea europaea var. sylvestris TaxID=158386 RepID=UPI000C1D087E|nr:ethylene-responsive transcription factor 5-like [Olea europaea var. sylvestris]